MYLLYSIGLLALTGLAVPLIIHLWNVKQGKTLKIGSIVLLGESSRLSSRSYNITDWLLLILRSLLLILLAFILAQPYLKKEMGKEAQKGWILTEKSQLPEVLQNNRKSIDSLLKAGYELHEFDVGFQKMNLKDTLTQDTASQHPLNYTSLIRQLDGQLPAGFPVYLFADHRLSRMGADLPEIAFNLKWQELTLKDTLSNWMANVAHKTYEVQSSPSLTNHKIINAENGPGVISVLIYGGTHSADAAYIKAALAAIAGFTERNIKVNVYNKSNRSAEIANTDLVFWLSDQPVDAVLKAGLKKGVRLFTYEKGKATSVHTFINLLYSGTGNDQVMELNKRIIADKYQGDGLWTDGFGVPVLSFEKSGDVHHFHFYSKLNPQWTSLVWNEQFVKALMPIVIGNDGRQVEFGFKNNASDQRIWAKNQQKVFQVKKAVTVEKIDLQEPLSDVIWVIALIIFILERILSLREKANVNYN